MYAHIGRQEANGQMGACHPSQKLLSMVCGNRMPSWCSEHVGIGGEPDHNVPCRMLQPPAEAVRARTRAQTHTQEGADGGSGCMTQ